MDTVNYNEDPDDDGQEQRDQRLEEELFAEEMAARQAEALSHGHIIDDISMKADYS